MENPFIERYKYVRAEDVNAALIKQFRKDLGISQIEFAKYIGVSLGTVSTWETRSSMSQAARVLIAGVMRRSEKILEARASLLTAFEQLRAK